MSWLVPVPPVSNLWIGLAVFAAVIVVTGGLVYLFLG